MVMIEIPPYNPLYLYFKLMLLLVLVGSALEHHSQSDFQKGNQLSVVIQLSYF